MFGELNGLESICHLIITNQLELCTLSIPSPFNNNSTVQISASLKHKTKNTVEIINNSPFITCDVFVQAKVLSMDNGLDLTDEDNIGLLEVAVNKYLKEQIDKYLYKISKEYHSDIAGFGRHVVKNYLTIKEWNESNWLDNFRNSYFNVNVNTLVQGSDLLLRT